MLDSLRYWVSEMHVDGFRFDLAPALARRADGARRDLRRFFSTIAAGPRAGRGQADRRALGPRARRLPARRLSRRAGRSGTTATATTCAASGAATRACWATLASRLAGQRRRLRQQRRPDAGREHQLRDLPRRLHARRPRLATSSKHNEANGEDNRDGSDANCEPQLGRRGADRADSERSRTCATACARNLIATLLFSQGVPMLSHGDELGRTPAAATTTPTARTTRPPGSTGSSTTRRRDLPRVRAQRVRAARRAIPRCGAPQFFRGRAHPERGERDVTWLRPDGKEMEAAGLAAPTARALGMLIPREANPDEDEHGQPRARETLLLVFNAGVAAVRFRRPRHSRPACGTARSARPGAPAAAALTRASGSRPTA